MDWNRLKRMAALAICACALTGPATYAQSVETDGSVTVYTATTWDELNDLGIESGSYVVDRFGVSDGRLVAYGRLVPSSTIVMEPVDERLFGSWTGIGTGYGESGVESRSDMLADYDVNVIRPDRMLGGQMFALQSASGRVGTGIDLQFGPTSGNDRVATGIDLHFGPTSANDRTSIDARFGPTSGNDREVIDLQMGPTSGNDRVAGGPIDLKFGPTSENDRTRIDARFGPTSENDRTAIELQAGPTSENDRVAPVMLSSSEVILPVEVMSASCDAVTLSFGAGEIVTITPAVDASASTRASLCAFSETRDAAILSAHLNDVVLVID